MSKEINTAGRPEGRLMLTYKEETTALLIVDSCRPDWDITTPEK